MKTFSYSLLVLVVLSFASPNVGFSQTVGFWIENDILNDVFGNPLTPASSTPVHVYGGTFDGNFTPAQLTTAIDNVRSASSPSAAASELQLILNDFTQWGVIPPASGGAEDFYDWFGSASAPVAGAKIYMVIITDTINSILPSTQVGIVSAAGVVSPSLGVDNIGFNTGTTAAHRWDQAYMGTLGSLTLEAIPEPRAYAALFGVCVLALAVIRRRRK